LIITGSFSRLLIEDLKSDLGQENVSVVNIVRNPSSAFLIHQRSEYDATFTAEEDHKNLIESILSAISLKDYPGVTTIKFEDLLSSNTFVVNGQNIPKPIGYESYNGLFTQHEFESILPLEIHNSAAVDSFNQSISNFNISQIANVDNPLPELVNILKDQPGNFPVNLFDALGYSPLTYEQLKNT